MLQSIAECMYMYNPFKNKRYVGLGVPVATQGISMLSPTLNGITPDASYTISGGTEISQKNPIFARVNVSKTTHSHFCEEIIKTH